MTRSDLPPAQIAPQTITLMSLLLVFGRMNSFCYFCCGVRKTYCCLPFPRSIDASSLKMYVFHCSYVQSLRARHHSRRIFAASSLRSGLCFAIHFLMPFSFNIPYIVFFLMGRPVSARTCLYVSFGFLRTNRRRVLRSRRDNFWGRPGRESVVPSWRCELRRRVDLTVVGVKNVFCAISATPRPVAAQVWIEPRNHGDNSWFLILFKSKGARGVR